MTRLVLAFFAVIALAGCAYHQPSHPDAVTLLPSDYASEAKTDAVQLVTEPHREWWGRFNMPELNAFIEELGEGSYDLAIAKQRIARARALLGQQESRDWPTLDGGSTANETETQRPAGSTFPPDRGEVEFVAAYEVDLWGQRKAAKHAAALSVVAEEAEYKSIALSLQAQVTQQYFALLALEARVTTTEQNLAATEELLRLVQLRFDLGRGTGIELDQQRTILLDQQSQLITLKRDRDIARRALAVLLGRDGLLDADVQGHLADATVPAVAIVQPATLLQFRPDILVAEADLQISDAVVFQNKTRRWPSLSLTADASLADTFASNADWTTSLIGRLTGPIFNAGRIKNEIKAAEADASIALLNYRRTVILALQEALDSMTELEHQRVLYEVREAEVKTNERLYDLSRTSFNAGRLGFINVLDAQRNLFTATERVVDAKRDYLTAVINTYRAMGVPPTLGTNP